MIKENELFLIMFPSKVAKLMLELRRSFEVVSWLKKNPHDLF